MITERMRRLSDRIGPRRAEQLMTEVAQLQPDGATSAGDSRPELLEVIDHLLDSADVLLLEMPPPDLRPRLWAIFEDHHLSLLVLSPGSAAPATSAAATSAAAPSARRPLRRRLIRSMTASLTRRLLLG